MRRLVFLSSFFVAVAVSASCSSDGREIGPPTEIGTLSISTTTDSTTTLPAVVGPDDIDISLTLPGKATLGLTAPWRDGAEVDARHSCDGPNVSPALSWSAAPPDAVEIALTMQDLDAPGFTHWVAAGIDPTTVAIAEGQTPLGAVEALNGNGDLGYTGPCPPAGSTHNYVLTVHYLGEATGLADGDSGEGMLARLAASAIWSAEVSGTFSRP